NSGPELWGHPEVRARLMETMGEVYLNLGLLSQAEPLLKSALATSAASMDPASEQALKAREQWAELLFWQARYPEAVQFSRETLAIARKSFGSDHPAPTSEMEPIASSLLEHGSSKEAEEIQRELLATYRRLDPPDSPRIVTSLNRLANALSRQERFAEAAPLRNEAL